ncbi:dolichyl-phosphate beta-glucosyltransferase [Aquimarina sp. 2201CG5-10]|uniref:dolichyl-phosphate beta-glucosyltransferase n=1 Tax=Aquimarina callyspongiae TaxID=3098150 RepID=UPI002AB493C0|nr:dolichyl-phosphate beta-glucosyltransferase [Aquimarina sp. 2201CG5-10]MDY8134651.1 dolichyl-phosphate beta-glucosyltransferase [Aquimarina sp. 2201CG5-10]
MKTGIIIPCYNEEKRLNVSAFLNFINKENNYHLCFVNDGSKDNTIDVLKEIQSANPLKVSVIDVKKNAGKAAAVRVGARYLHSRGDISCIGFIDADLSTDFEDFDGLLKTLKTNKKLSMVFGSRAKNASEGIEKDTLRACFSKIIKMLVFFILRLPIEDTQCGAKVFRAELVPVLFEKNFFSRWLFDVEMFLRMKKHYGKAVILDKIYEQPLKRWVHMDDSKLGLKDSLEIPYRLLSIWFNYNVLQSLNYNSIEAITEPIVEIYGMPVTAMAA